MNRQPLIGLWQRGQKKGNRYWYLLGAGDKRQAPSRVTECLKEIQV